MEITYEERMIELLDNDGVIRYMTDKLKELHEQSFKAEDFKMLFSFEYWSKTTRKAAEDTHSLPKDTASLFGFDISISSSLMSIYKIVPKA